MFTYQLSESEAEMVCAVLNPHLVAGGVILNSVKRHNEWHVTAGFWRAGQWVSVQDNPPLQAYADRYGVRLPIPGGMVQKTNTHRMSQKAAAVKKAAKAAPRRGSR